MCILRLIEETLSFGAVHMTKMSLTFRLSGLLDFQLFLQGRFFCDFLFTFICSKPLLKRNLLKKERNCIRILFKIDTKNTSRHYYEAIVTSNLNMLLLHLFCFTDYIKENYRI